jgi:aerobic-type carbon monoxide dehydrogenase small subunit (CoxS/CutS family)
MAGNICRCATYVRIRQAIKDAAAKASVGKDAAAGAKVSA